MRPLPAADLEERVRLALDRGAVLLNDPEREVAQTILDLPDELALAYARLTGRVADVFRLPDLRLPGVDDEVEAVQRRRRGLERGDRGPRERRDAALERRGERVGRRGSAARAATWASSAASSRRDTSPTNAPSPAACAEFKSSNRLQCERIRMF